jgi:arginase
MVKTCALIGAPIETGASQRGCVMGPASLRTAGLATSITELDWQVHDLGDLSIPVQTPMPHHNISLHHLAETIAWTTTLRSAARDALMTYDFPVFLGGDHSMAAGTVAGMCDYAADQGRPVFVLWLDAHSDFHSLDSSQSGNLHGTPAAYFTGQTGFDGFPPIRQAVDPRRICMIGLRSVDPAERGRIIDLGVDVQDMRAIDETGVLTPLQNFLQRVQAENGLLHLSLDVDFLDPGIAPAVGTTVPGGATFREAHLIMEVLCDSGLVRSLDLVELNPFLDERGKTASLLVELTASLLGRRVLDRPTRAFAN